MRQITRINANKNTKARELVFPKVSFAIQGCIFEIRKQYGPGQKEVVYQKLLEEKLKAKRLRVEREKRIDIYSVDSGKVVGSYRPDLVVENKVVIEVKSSRLLSQQDEKQLYYYLRNSSYELGYLVNFSTRRLFMKRIVYSNVKKPFLNFRVL